MDHLLSQMVTLDFASVAKSGSSEDGVVVEELDVIEASWEPKEVGEEYLAYPAEEGLGSQWTYQGKEPSSSMGLRLSSLQLTQRAFAPWPLVEKRRDRDCDERLNL